MQRCFNVGGPCDPEVHYMLDPLVRLPNLKGLIGGRSYFVLHAPRQTGKTTSLIALAKKLTEEGKYAAVLLSMQPGAGLGEDIGAAEEAVLARWQAEARAGLPPELRPPLWAAAPAGAGIGDALSTWAEHCPRPLVIFIDEIDALQGATLRSVLHQIRAGHPQRPTGFPACLALVGLRDLQDYKFGSGSEHPPRPAPSPFNIIVRSLTMRNFYREEVAELYQQHTAATGQAFSAEAVDEVFRLTYGQPWLVNALAQIMVEDLEPDPTVTPLLTPEHVEKARVMLIERRDVHLRVLAERLRDQRLRGVLEPILSEESVLNFDEEDVRFALDLGLVKRGQGGGLEISNPIYRAVLFDALMARPREALPTMTRVVWMTDGKLDLDKLLASFLEFWRQHGSVLLATIDYPEIAPHLVIFAYMQRVVNGGGFVRREEPVQRGRLDIFVQHGDVKLALELKVWRPHEKDPLEEGLAQLEGYMKHLGTEHGWLFIFDRRVGQPKLIDRLNESRALTPGGKEVVVLRS